MVKLFGLTAAAAMLLPFASCSPKVYPVETKDSVRVEIRERVVRDSVFFEVERQVEKIVTRDTTSILENDWAKSEASVDSSGFLHHTLKSIPRKIYVPYHTTVRDTVRLEGRVETVVQEVNRLTPIQGFWIVSGKALLTLFVSILLVAILLMYMKSKGL